MRIRKTKEERKAEIRAAACSVFLERGIQKTTMDEIICRTTLSKGGVYHHYANIYEILFDIFITSNDQRIDIMRNWMTENNLTMEQLRSPSYMAQAITDKVLANTPYSKLYAMFLVASRTDPNLAELYETLVNTCRTDLEEFFQLTQNQSIWDDESYTGITEIINMFIVSTQLLGTRAYFLEHREDVAALICAYLTRRLPEATDAS